MPYDAIFGRTHKKIHHKLLMLFCLKNLTILQLTFPIFIIHTSQIKKKNKIYKMPMHICNVSNIYVNLIYVYLRELNLRTYHLRN